MPTDDLRAISQLLEERFGLDALWLFGSQALGTARSDSDLDVAALFQRRPAPAEILETRLDLTAKLGRDLDLVDLDRASPILVMQVLRYGRLVVDANPVHRISLMSSAPGRYEDVKIIRREAERALVQRVHNG